MLCMILISLEVLRAFSGDKGRSVFKEYRPTAVMARPFQEFHFVRHVDLLSISCQPLERLVGV